MNKTVGTDHQKAQSFRLNTRSQHFKQGLHLILGPFDLGI